MLPHCRAEIEGRHRLAVFLHQGQEHAAHAGIDVEPEPVRFRELTELCNRVDHTVGIGG